MDIKYWSTAAASNNSAPPDGWPEGQAPSTLNDCAREMMASIRRWYDDAQWTDLNHTPTYVTTSTFTLAGDKKSIYEIGRRVRVSDGANTIYGTIYSATYTAGGNTGVYVTNDSGQYTVSMSSVAVGIITSSNTSLPDPVVSYDTTAGSTADVTRNGSDRTATLTTIILPKAGQYVVGLEVGANHSATTSLATAHVDILGPGGTGLFVGLSRTHKDYNFYQASQYFYSASATTTLQLAFSLVTTNGKFETVSGRLFYRNAQ